MYCIRCGELRRMIHIIWVNELRGRGAASGHETLLSRLSLGPSSSDPANKRQVKKSSLSLFPQILDTHIDNLLGLPKAPTHVPEPPQELGFGVC